MGKPVFRASPGCEIACPACDIRCAVLAGEADDAWRKQQRTYADQVENNLHHDVASRSLEIAAARCDWWRARVDECFLALQVAQTELTSAEAAAVRARRDYMRAHARRQALTTLVSNLEINRSSEERS